MDKKRYMYLEAAGTLVVTANAVFLHEFYAFSGKSVLGALLGAVNESVWEHLKIYALSYVVWAIAEYLCAKPPLRAFVTAKTAGVYALMLSITAFYYISGFVFGKEILFLSIGSAVVFAALSFLLSYRLTLWEKNSGDLFYLSLFLLALLFAMILSFSFFPLKSDIFLDPITNTYGVQH